MCNVQITKTMLHIAEIIYAFIILFLIEYVDKSIFGHDFMCCQGDVYSLQGTFHHLTSH